MSFLRDIRRDLSMLIDPARPTAWEAFASSRRCPEHQDHWLTKQNRDGLFVWVCDHPSHRIVMSVIEARTLSIRHVAEEKERRHHQATGEMFLSMVAESREQEHLAEHARALSIDGTATVTIRAITGSVIEEHGG
jgi:hypothetical protein